MATATTTASINSSSVLIVRDDVFGSVAVFEDSDKGKVEANNWIDELKGMYGREWSEHVDQLDPIRLYPGFKDLPTEYVNAKQKYDAKQQKKAKDKTYGKFDPKLHSKDNSK